MARIRIAVDVGVTRESGSRFGFLRALLVPVVRKEKKDGKRM